MRLAYTLALLLLLALTCYVLWPGGKIGNAVRPMQPSKSTSGKITRENRATLENDDNGKSQSSSPKQNSPSETPEDYAEASFFLENPGAYKGVAALASKYGIVASWNPMLRRVLLHGSRREMRNFLDEPLLAGVQPEYNISIRMIPEKEENIITADGRPFFNSALKWIGIDSNQENRGKGVKIALLDTCVDTEAESLKGVKVSTDDLFKLSGENTAHGTMVASLLAGDGKVTGVVPAAEILSIPVLDSDGYGDVFSLALAIVEAANSGADIISMSLGFEHESGIMKQAVEYAREKGCVLVASAGNEGVSPSGESTVCYPGAFDGVITVGAVNAGGTRAGFSSTGPEIDISAPGVGMFADNGTGTVFFSGTSAAAPLIAGTLAYMMSAHEGMTAAEAAELMLANANEAGMPGADSEYGRGTLDAARSINYDTPGIRDAAAASIVAGEDEDGNTVYYFTAQNRGTEDLPEMKLSCKLLTSNGVLSSDVTFNDVKAGQTAYAMVKAPNGGDTVAGASLEVSTSSEDSRKDNDKITVVGQ